MILNLYIDIFYLRSRSIVPSMIEAVETLEKSKKKLKENISSSKYTLLRLNVCLHLNLNVKTSHDSGEGFYGCSVLIKVVSKIVKIHENKKL